MSELIDNLGSPSEIIFGSKNYFFPTTQPTSINFNFPNGEEAIKITTDGFYVRGVKVEQNEHEAKIVLEAFLNLLSGRGLL